MAGACCSVDDHRSGWRHRKCDQTNFGGRIALICLGALAATLLLEHPAISAFVGSSISSKVVFRSAGRMQGSGPSPQHNRPGPTMYNTEGPGMRNSRQHHLGTDQVAQMAPTSVSEPPWALLHLQTAWKFKGVQEPSRSEMPKNLIAACNASFMERHPLNEQDYTRSYLPGDPCSMPAGLLAKLSSGQHVMIKVLGGSFTSGRLCYDGSSSDRACAWSSRLERKLREIFPKGNLTVLNQGMPGWHYATWLQSGMVQSLVDADVVILEGQVNSYTYGTNAYNQMEDLDELINRILEAARRQQQQIGVLMVDTFHSCLLAPWKCEVNCGKPGEGRQGHFNANISGINITYSYCTEWWLTPGIERLVSQHYKVPTASYRDAVWPVMDKPRPNVPCMWLGNAHPSALTHEMMANVVGYGLVRAVMESSSNTSCSQRSTATRLFQEMPVKQYCTAANASIDHHHNTTTAPRGTYMSSLNASSFQPLETGGWLWREDVPGKPGWIYERHYTLPNNTGTTPEVNATSMPHPHESDVVQQDTIRFKIHFSSQPQLQVTYLVSYEGVGSVELTLHKSTQHVFDNTTAVMRHVLNAAQKEPFSIPKTAVFVHPTAPPGQKKSSLLLPGSISEGEYIMAFRPLPGDREKFKLLGIASC